VGAHVVEVLANVEDEAVNPRDRARLRLIALTHDTFKHLVDVRQPREGENHHAMIARRFAERYTDDAEVLDVIELHDEAFNAWVKRERGGKWTLRRRVPSGCWTGSVDRPTSICASIARTTG
jgi:hypothetical protein